MKTVEQLAREAGVDAEEADTPAAYKTPWFSCTAEELQRFAELAIAQYRESLLAGSGEPEWYCAECDDPDYSRFAQDKADAAAIVSDKGGAISALYTADQMAAAVLRERDAMRAELAGVEAINKAAALEIVSLRAELEAAKADITRQSAALLDIARKAEALKQPCGDDPESPTAIRNGRYMHLSYLARAAMKGQP